MPPGPFAAATAVRAVDDHTWQSAIAPGWDIGGNANGGYLLAIGARAMLAATGRPDPVSITAHFLAPGKAGPVTVSTDVMKVGRRFSTASAVVASTERPLVAILGSFGELGSPEGPELIDGGPPLLPDPEDCVPIVATETFPPPFMGNVELRLHPDDVGFAHRGPSGRPLVRGWFRLLEGEPIDGVALLCAVDAFPPTAFNAHLPIAWTPTLELTSHVRARPVPGWLSCQFTTHFIAGGFLEEDGEVWDASGRLVAQSRQLALVPATP